MFSLSKFNETVRTPCMHRFCRSCLDMALRRRRMCPLCNKVLNTRRSIMPSSLFDELTRVYEMIKKSYEEDHYVQSLSQELHYNVHWESKEPQPTQFLTYPAKESC